MMISPEEFYETELKDKDEKQLLSIIRGLKNQIGHLKNVVEHPEYLIGGSAMHPNEKVRISCNREYMFRAIQALEEKGYKYQPSKAELKVREFQDNLKYLSKVTLEIGGFFYGSEKYSFEIQGDDLKFDTTRMEPTILYFDFDDLIRAVEMPTTKDELIDMLSGLYIGEWRKYYDPRRFGYDVLDGTQWRVVFEYSNRLKSVEFAGCNDFPYNFEKFEEIFGIDNDLDCLE